MRTPTRSMSGNIRWTRSGTVWADFILTGLPYGLRPTKDRFAVRDLHTALFRSLPGESLILGVVAGLDPAVIVERMLAGVDLESSPDWVAECEATLDTLDAIGPGQRIYWLSVPLGNDKPSDRALEPMKAAMADLRDRVGLPRQVIEPDELERRRLQAARIAEQLPGPFHATPATPAQMVWLHEHQLRRGLFLDQDVPVIDVDNPSPPPKAASALSEPLLDEGGQTDLDPKASKFNAASRRFLKVVDVNAVGEPAASYQGLMVVSDVPDAGMVFPGGELLGRIDQSALPVDWAMRLTIRSSHEVASTNQKALRNLNEQFTQRDGELSHGVSGLERSAEDLAEYAAILENDKLEVEAQATLIFCVGAPDPDILRGQVHHLSEYFASAGYKLSQPLGYQEELWWALQPGVPTGRAVREFSQITTSQVLATLVPLASTALGDAKGTLLGLNIAHGPLLDENIPCGPTSVVLHDLEGATDRDVSGSLAIAGELGSGKSLTMKVLAGGVIDRGGRVIIADRTQMGEYAQWAKSVTKAVVVDVADPKRSLDPLRLFGPVTGARIAQSFLTPLLNVAPTSPHGVVLSEVLDPDYLNQHQIDSLGSLTEHLSSGACDLHGSDEVARIIRVFSRKDIGRVIFDQSVPTLQLSDPAVIIRTHTLLLPSRDELQHEHLFAQLPLEKIFGRAMYALIAAIARTVCFAESDVLGLFVLDECHSVTISPEGEREIVDFVRDGRKHRAAVLLGSHDPIADFGSATLRGLIPTRILMRHRDKTLAQRGLEWLDLDPQDDELVELVRTETSPTQGGAGVPIHRRGESLMRDSNGNVGRLKVLVPSRADRAAAVKTSGPVGGSPVDGQVA